jgi:hypothetical protein
VGRRGEGRKGDVTKLLQHAPVATSIWGDCMWFPFGGRLITDTISTTEILIRDFPLIISPVKKTVSLTDCITHYIQHHSLILPYQKLCVKMTEGEASRERRFKGRGRAVRIFQKRMKD